jgi:ornithine cyclodeaminase/alanine dehydrogenase-like protein (mu-crystallin family)
MHIITHDQVTDLLPMAECMAVMKQGLIDLSAGSYYQPLRMKAAPEGSSNLMAFMPALRTGADRLWGVKLLVMTPDNPKRGLDSHQGGVMLFDGASGVPMALVDATAITAIRTAAVTGVASAALAPKTVRRVAVIGAGHQASTHVEALRLAHPGATIVLGSRTPARAADLAKDLGCAAAASLQEALRDADVVCTVTNSAVPVIEQAWLKPGCHLNLVGASLPSAREADSATIAAGRLFADRRESCLNEAGEYLLAVKEGAIGGPGHIVAEVGEVLAGTHKGRTGDGDFTIFKSLGLAVEDLIAAEHVVRKAREKGIGTQVAW